MMTKHRDIDTLIRLKQGRLPLEEKLAVMSHLAACGQCAESFAQLYDEQELIPLSPDFVEEMTDKLSPLPPISIGEMKKKKDKKKEFYAYSFRVSVAACMALVILFSGNFSQGSVWIQEHYKLKEDVFQTNKMTEQLRDFSDRIFRFDFSKQN